MRRYTSEMARRFEEFDWSKTSIGPVERWPRTWQNVVNLLLASSFPSAVGLGPELIYLALLRSEWAVRPEVARFST